MASSAITCDPGTGICSDGSTGENGPGDLASTPAPSGFWDWFDSVFSGGDNVATAAVRANGIDPTTGLGTQPANLNQDLSTQATQIATAATTQYQSDLAKNTAAINQANKNCGGFLADLLNPFSANVDSSQWNCQVANSLNKYWPLIVALGVGLVVLSLVGDLKNL